MTNSVLVNNKLNCRFWGLDNPIYQRTYDIQHLFGYHARRNSLLLAIFFGDARGNGLYVKNKGKIMQQLNDSIPAEIQVLEPEIFGKCS